jgi:hypothetical protein
MKIYTFDIYAKDKPALTIMGWDEITVKVVADNRKDAIEYLQQWPLFSEVKHLVSVEGEAEPFTKNSCSHQGCGWYRVDKTTNGQAGFVFKVNKNIYSDVWTHNLLCIAK